jgi:tetratricopeptide (TPR) repeat protein
MKKTIQFLLNYWDVACRVLTIMLIFLVLTSTIFAQSKQKVVRLNEETEAWLEGNRQKTLELLLRKEKAGKADISTLYNIGYLYFLEEEFNSALRYFQNVINEDDSYIYAYLQIARIHKKFGLIHAAYSDLEKGMDEDENNVDLILEMAEITKELKLTNITQQLYQRVLENDDDNARALVGLAEIYRQQGKFEEAKILLEGNPNIFPEAIILQEKAKLYRALGKDIESKKFLTQIILEYPNSQSWSHIRDTLKIKYNLENLPAPGPLPTYTYIIDPNEELDYKVSYGPMTLGWLKVRIMKPEIIGDKTVFPIIFFVDTNPSYGFIMSLHHIYESYIDPQTLNAAKSRLYTPGSEDYLVRVYYYSYDINIFESYAMTEEGRFQYIVKDLPRKVQDSTSMLYFARGLVSDKMNGVTAVVINEEYKYGHIKYLNETEPITIEDKEIQSLKIFARAEFDGIAGMNGDAWGWFAPDQQAMPLKGNIEILVGSISLEIDEEKTILPNYHEDD